MPSSSSGCAARENAPGRLRTGLARRVRRPAASDIKPDGGQVRDALAQLSDRHRAMLYMSHYLGRTTAQISAELGIDDDIVKNELHHALHALRMTLCNGRDTPLLADRGPLTHRATDPRIQA